MVDAPLIFGVGDHRMCHSITIINDAFCELSLTEGLVSFLEYDNTTMPITVNPSRAHLIIQNDRGECGKFHTFY